jgi:hypothetical protein
MMVLAIRPSSWNFPLLLHVGGALLLVGTLVVAVGCMILAWRSADTDASATLTRFGFRTVLLGVLPSFILMRLAGQWIASKEGLDNSKATWIGIGYAAGDFGLLVLIVAAILAWLAARKRAALGVTGRISTVLVAILLIAYLVAIWAMTTKPS